MHTSLGPSKSSVTAIHSIHLPPPSRYLQATARNKKTYMYYHIYMHVQLSLQAKFPLRYKTIPPSLEENSDYRIFMSTIHGNINYTIETCRNYSAFTNNLNCRYPTKYRLYKRYLSISTPFFPFTFSTFALKDTPQRESEHRSHKLLL